jgi:hypothetical protein
MESLKVEFTINAPVFDRERMEEYLGLFARMLLVAEDETIVDAKINDSPVHLY